MKILAIDDERLALDRVKRLGTRLGTQDIDVMQNPQDVMAAIYANAYDVIMLDIQMPGIDGLTLAGQILEASPNSFIVFVTAHSEFALKSFEIGAYDYILKPIEESAFLRVIKKAQRFSRQEAKLVGRIGKNIVVLSYSDVFYFKADLNETFAQTKDGFVFLKKKISELEALALDGYLKVHRSYLVNMNKIKQIKPATLGRYILEFDGINESITSSKDGSKTIKTYLNA